MQIHSPSAIKNTKKSHVSVGNYVTKGSVV